MINKKILQIGIIVNNKFLRKLLILSFLSIFLSAIHSEETKKFRVPRVVVDKMKSEFVGIQIASLSELKAMDQFLIQGSIPYVTEKSVEVDVSIAGSSGEFASATIRLKGLDHKKKEEMDFVIKSTPNIPWQKFVSRLDKADWNSGIGFVTFTENGTEREYQLNISHHRDSKTSVYYFDEYGHFIRKDKMKF